MGIVIDNEKCVGDGVCVDMCPEEVLEMGEEYPIVVREDNCTECKSCEVACEWGALKCVEK